MGIKNGRDSTPGPLMLNEKDCRKENGGDWQPKDKKLALGSCFGSSISLSNSKRSLPIPLLKNAAMLYVLDKFFA